MKKSLITRLHQFEKVASSKSSMQLGYPLNLSANFRELFQNFDFSLLLNNIGDPVTTWSASNRFFFEKEVLEYFADLYLLDKKEMRGYVTSGGSEGNLYGLYLGRENYPHSVLLFSESSHYSIPKYAKLLKMPYEVVKSQPNGEMDYKDLENKVAKLRHKSIIVSLNIGTTMSGAIDDIVQVCNVLAIHNEDYYIHCDAALFGSMIPFLYDKNPVNFLHKIGSLSISGHKFFGTPTPCGIVLTRNKYVENIKSVPGYTGSEDTTILGSRSGHAPIFLWYAIKAKNKLSHKKDVVMCINLAKYLHSQIQEFDSSALINQDSNIVTFNKPSEFIVSKWKLAVEKDQAHVVVMPHVTREILGDFINDLKTSLLKERK